MRKSDIKRIRRTAALLDKAKDNIGKIRNAPVSCSIDDFGLSLIQHDLERYSHTLLELAKYEENK